MESLQTLSQTTPNGKLSGPELAMLYLHFKRLTETFGNGGGGGRVVFSERGIKGQVPKKSSQENVRTVRSQIKIGKKSGHFEKITRSL